MSAPTKRQLAARHRTRLKTMAKKLAEMAVEWEDLDQFCVNALTDLADGINKCARDLADDEEPAAATDRGAS